MSGLWIEFGGVGIREAKNVSGVFDGDDLHTKADAEERDLILAGVFRGLDHAFDATEAEAAWDKDAIDAFKDLLNILWSDGFRVDPFDFAFRA